MYVLYSLPRSRGTRVVWTLEEIGAEYEYRNASPRDELVLEMNPMRKLPVLVDEDFVLTESAAICTYLADQHPECGLAPAAATRERARFDAWNFFLMTEIDQPLWNYSKNSYLYPEKVRVPEVLGACRNEFRRAEKALAAMLGDNEFLMGDQFMIPDIVCGHCLAWAKNIEFELKEANVIAYADRVTSRRPLKKTWLHEARVTENAKNKV